MAKVINPIVLPPTVTVEFTREEALVVQALCGRMNKTDAQYLISAAVYPKARSIIDKSDALFTIYNALEDYFGDER